MLIAKCKYAYLVHKMKKEYMNIYCCAAILGRLWLENDQDAGGRFRTDAFSRRRRLESYVRFGNGAECYGAMINTGNARKHAKIACTRARTR